MLFEYSDKSSRLQQQLAAFMERHVYPNEAAYAAQLEAAADRFAPLPLMEELKQKARDEGLWNLFVPESHGEFSAHGGLSNLDYYPLAETMGRVLWSAEVFNCSAPDTGNMEVLMKYATPEQQQQWLEPLLAGEIRSSYAMTEPQVASSDATNIELSMTLEGDEWLLDGRKWFITGAMNQRTRIIIVMGKSDPANPDRHRQQTQVLVPRDAPGVEVVRALTTLGYDDAPIGHAEIHFNQVRVPAENVLLGAGRGFEIAQGRLGPGRMHHCSFAEIEMARLLIQQTCHRMDQVGAQAARDMIAACKISVPLTVQNIVDRCMQMHGAGGLSRDYFLAEAFNYARWCRQADGPDQVHRMALGKQIIERYGD
jgi:acyl-CoA dehydrogenase